MLRLGKSFGNVSREGIDILCVNELPGRYTGIWRSIIVYIILSSGYKKCPKRFCDSLIGFSPKFFISLSVCIFCELKGQMIFSTWNF